MNAQSVSLSTAYLCNGGGGRTRTYEAMRRLIYSQLPLPLGTLPRSTALRSASLTGDRSAMERKTAAVRQRTAVGAFMGEAPCQSQPSEFANLRVWPLFGPD
jgi:hypothetical protein